MVLRLTADHPGQLSFSVGLVRPETSASTEADGTTGLLLQGQMPDTAHAKGLSYAALLQSRVSGGDVKTVENRLVVKGADAVTLLITAGTDYKALNAWPNYLGKDHLGITRKQMAEALKRSDAELKSRQVEDHQALFRRVSLNLGSSAADALSTDRRLEAIKQGQPDPGFAALYFQFGRYLMISCSRPGGLPANLQGLWGDRSNETPSSYTLPWRGDYHVNINLQMNYWPVESTNLSECSQPLNEFIASLQKPGEKTATVQYGLQGWTIHHISNIWGHTVPADKAEYGMFPMAGPWLTRHLWEHYEYSQDAAFLQQAWPLLKGSAEFVLGWLVVDQKTSLLVSGPASSPENQFKRADGAVGYFCMGPTMDQMIAWDLFSNVLKAAKVLGLKEDFIGRVEAARARLRAPQIGKDGRIMEWAEEFQEPEMGHRHISHLYGLHPGNQINIETPELFAAARKSLQVRLDNGGAKTGWSRAWVINFRARLRDGDQAHDNLQMLFSKSTMINLFDTHPPFQIDGNFGGTAGIAEMLLQSRTALDSAGETGIVYSVDLLPALPRAWPDGSARGLRAKGGLTVDLAWEKGTLKEAVLRADRDQEFQVGCGKTVQHIKLSKGQSVTVNGMLKKLR